MQRMNNGLQLSEVFTSIEGEGIFLGTKTLFVRMAGCHLKCYWCDTAYALAMDSGTSYSIDNAKRLISKCLQPNTFKVNFTGGEPLIQYEAIMELAKFVKDKGLRTCLESSCYDARRFAKVIPDIDICKVEFKMSNSKVVDINSYVELLNNEIECLKIAVKHRTKTTFIKVVVTNSTDIGEFKRLVRLIFESLSSPEDISGFIIQPVYGFDEISAKALLDFYDIVYSFYHNVRIIPQIHKAIGAR